MVGKNLVCYHTRRVRPVELRGVQSDLARFEKPTGQVQMKTKNTEETLRI